jgi:hypothetical protein
VADESYVGLYDTANSHALVPRSGPSAAAVAGKALPLAFKQGNNCIGCIIYTLEENLKTENL